MLILKGIIIGIGKIIPGVSGSMLAITLGIYEKLIKALNGFFKKPKDNFKFLFKICIGIIISIVVFSNIILRCLNRNYIITMFFFIGLIIGGLDDIKKSIKGKNIRITIISFSIVIFIGILNIDNQIYIQNNILLFLYFVFIGFIDALTTIIPGISGTATLMMLGAYDTLIKCLANVFDFYYILDNLKILIPFSVGFIIGIIIISKLVEYLFKNFESNMYSSILGFALSTILIMFVKSFNSFYTFKDLCLAFIFLSIGFYITKKLNQKFLVE